MSDPKTTNYVIVSELPGQVLIGSTWVPAGSSEVALTPEEVAVVKRHPALRLLKAAA